LFLFPPVVMKTLKYHQLDCLLVIGLLALVLLIIAYPAAPI